MSNITLKDVADATNVSVNTVSRALRDMPDIGEATKTKIRKTAELLGYKKNMAASMLKTKRSHTIGVVVTDLENPIFASMVKGIELACKAPGYTVMLSNSNESAQEEARAVSGMFEYGVDGVILVPSMENDRIVRWMAAQGLPHILLGRKFPHTPANCVLNDDVCGGRLAAEHLFSLGHRSFLYLAPPMHISPAADRLEGFRQALADAGLPANAVRVVECGVSKNAGYKAMKTLLHDGFSETAVFCFSDYVALGVYSAANEAGISIPDQLSVVGYDDIDISEFLYPPLTTVDLCKFRLGKLAGEQLMEMLSAPEQNKDAIRQTIMRPSLIVRSSTAEIR